MAQKKRTRPDPQSVVREGEYKSPKKKFDPTSVVRGGEYKSPKKKSDPTSVVREGEYRSTDSKRPVGWEKMTSSERIKFLKGAAQTPRRITKRSLTK
jgi:hypothetical protein